MRTAWLRAASKPACLDRTSHCSGKDIYEGSETKGQEEMRTKWQKNYPGEIKERDTAKEDGELFGEMIIELMS